MLAGALLVFMITLVIIHTLAGLSKQSVEQSELAAAVLTAEARIQQGVIILDARAGQFLSSAEFVALSASQQVAVREFLTSNAEVLPRASDLGISGSKIPDIGLTLGLREVVRLQETLADLSGIERAARGSGEPVGQATALLATGARAAKDDYFLNPSLPNFILMRSGLISLGRETSLRAPYLVARNHDGQEALYERIKHYKWVVLIAGVVLGSFMLLVSLYAGSRLADSFDIARQERDALKETTDRLSRRNSQLNSLYSVFSEITDSLSVKYVVQSALQEARWLSGAEFIVMRLLEGEELKVVGSLSSDGSSLDYLEPVRLGAGLAGRVAKTGRTMKLNSVLTDQFQATVTIPGAQSCVIMPLIVGARVIGTLGCWSTNLNAFDEEDVHILEMMASQVAAAITAANVNESSERRAHHDALTGLPNRRQLSNDLQGLMPQFVEEHHQAVVAMIDIDHFKRFNDDFGHKVGDITLQRVASVMKSAIRDEDLIYRCGGEEFLVVFVDAGRDEAMALAERVRVAVASMTITRLDMEPIGPVTISLGLALLPEQGTDWEALFELADAALYESKQEGRNRITLWHGGIETRAA